MEGCIRFSGADYGIVTPGTGSFKKKLNDYAIQANRTGDGLQLEDPSWEGLEQVLALIHFYLHEEPTTFDRIALLWNRIQFALQFEDKMRIKTPIKG